MSNDINILVAEDDELIRTYLTTLLQAADYGVTSAASGRDALALLDAGLEPELLLTDVVMAGGMDGIELARRARLVLPGIRILFASGCPPMLEHEPLATGAQFLAKPFRRKACLEAVRLALAERRGP